MHDAFVELFNDSVPFYCLSHLWTAPFPHDLLLEKIFAKWVAFIPISAVWYNAAFRTSILLNINTVLSVEGHATPVTYTITGTEIGHFRCRFHHCYSQLAPLCDRLVLL